MVHHRSNRSALAMLTFALLALIGIVPSPSNSWTVQAFSTNRVAKWAQSSTSRCSAVSNDDNSNNHDNDNNSNNITPFEPAHGQMTPRQARILLPLLAMTAPQSAMALQSIPQAFEASRGQYYGGSLTSSVINLRVAGTLRKRGYFPYNTMIAAALTGNELNDTPGSLIPSLQSKLLNVDTGVFAMDIAAPGVSEFISHCPGNGNDKLLIIVAPDVGIDTNGVLGQVERFGQSAPSPSSRLLSDVVAGTKSGDVGKIVAKTNGNHNDVVASAVLGMYDVCAESVQQQMKDEILSQPNIWNTVSEITVLGGVIVHRGRGLGMSKGEDYFQPLMMKAYSANGEIQLYDGVFGDLSTPRDRV